MKILELDYRQDYIVQLLSTQPHGADCLEFRAKEVPAVGVGAWKFIKVIPTNGDTWVGAFQPGDEGLSAVSSTPSPTAVCVVNVGDAYFVPVLEPQCYSRVPLTPVKSLAAIPKRELMALVGYTSICAYGPNGLVWHTRRFAWDGIKIERVTAKGIECVVWDPLRSCDVRAFVDAQSGSVTGGTEGT